MLEWSRFIPTMQVQKDKGQPTSLDSMPELPWYLESWYQDFQSLSFSRVIGYASYNPIDIPSIIQYARAVGVKSYELPRFIRVIQYLDSIYLEHWAKKAENSTPKQ